MVYRLEAFPDPTSFRDSSADGAYHRLVKNTIDCGTYVNYGNNVGVGSTIELRPTKITFPGTKKYITIRKKFNLAFALAEVLWICQGRKDVGMLVFYNKQIAEYSDNGEVFNAAYGDRIFAKNGNQFRKAYDKLAENPFTRHAVLSIWDVEADNDPGHKDYACNNLSQLLIRTNALEWSQILRSNDLLWGLPYNMVQFVSLMQIMASMLGVGVGSYTHYSNSSHIYANMIDEARELLNNKPVYYDSPPLVCSSYEDFEKTIQQLSELEENVRTNPEFNFNPNTVEDIGWRNLICTIAFTAKLKHKLLMVAVAYMNQISVESYERQWCQEKFDKMVAKNAIE